MILCKCVLLYCICFSVARRVTSQTRHHVTLLGTISYPRPAPVNGRQLNVRQRFQKSVPFGVGFLFDLFQYLEPQLQVAVYAKPSKWPGLGRLNRAKFDRQKDGTSYGTPRD